LGRGCLSEVDGRRSARPFAGSRLGGLTPPTTASIQVTGERRAEFFCSALDRRHPPATIVFARTRSPEFFAGFFKHIRHQYAQRRIRTRRAQCSRGPGAQNFSRVSLSTSDTNTHKDARAPDAQNFLGPGQQHQYARGAHSVRADTEPRIFRGFRVRADPEPRSRTRDDCAGLM
jgi:hypothetical protein